MVKTILRLIAVAVGWPILHWVWKGIENAALGWADDQVAMWLGIESPTPAYVMTLLVDWGIPIAALILLMYGYHVAWNYIHRTQRQPSLRAEAVYPKPSLSTRMFPPRMIDMPDAARELADALRGLTLGDYINRMGGEPSKQIDLLAHYLVKTTAPIFARYENGAKLTEINKNEFKSGVFINAGTTFVKQGMMGVPSLVDICIRRRDLKNAIAEVKALNDVFPKPEAQTWKPGEGGVINLMLPNPDRIPGRSLAYEDLGESMIEAGWHINNFIEHESKVRSEEQLVNHYHTRYAPVVIYLWEEARRRGFRDEELDRFYQHPRYLVNVRTVGQRLGALGRQVKSSV